MLYRRSEEVTKQLAGSEYKFETFEFYFSAEELY